MKGSIKAGLRLPFEAGQELDGGRSVAGSGYLLNRFPLLRGARLPTGRAAEHHRGSAGNLRR